MEKVDNLVICLIELFSKTVTFIYYKVFRPIISFVFVISNFFILQFKFCLLPLKFFCKVFIRAKSYFVFLLDFIFGYLKNVKVYITKNNCNCKINIDQLKELKEQLTEHSGQLKKHKEQLIRLEEKLNNFSENKKKNYNDNFYSTVQPFNLVVSNKKSYDTNPLLNQASLLMKETELSEITLS